MTTQALKKHRRLTLAKQKKPSVGTIELRRSMLADPILLLVLALSALAFIPLTIEFPGSVQIVNLDFGESFGIRFPIPFFGILPVMLSVLLLHKHYNYKYMITPDNVRVLEGIISLRLNDKRVDFEHVRGVEIECSLAQRFLDIGDIEIGSAMASEEALVLKGIKNPQFYRNLIEERSAISGSSGD